jgi:hypothetical protein
MKRNSGIVDDRRALTIKRLAKAMCARFRAHGGAVIGSARQDRAE